MTRAAHFTVLDTHYSADRVRAHIAAYGGRAARLHIIALDPTLLPGVHRMPDADPAVTLDRVSSTLAALVPELCARLDALHLEDIAREGAGWMRTLAKLCEPGARLYVNDLTPTQAKGFHDAGFRFDAAGTSADFTGRRPQPQQDAAPDRRAIVLGAGVAGCAASERLAARGWQVTLVEQHALPAQEASGNLAGIFMPLVSKDDNISTRLTRAAFLYALRYWDSLGRDFPGARCGVLQVARDAAHARVQREIAAHWNYPPDYARWLERDEASAVLGHPAPDGGWLFPQAGWARPFGICAAMLDACGSRLERRFGVGPTTIEPGGPGWRVLDAAGGLVAEAPHLVLANGAGARTLEQTAALPLARVRGQVTHLSEGMAPALPVVLCREAYMTPPVEGLVCTGATYDEIDEAQLLPSSQHENILKARSMLADPELASNAPLAGRVGFRCVPPDRLPLVGAVPDDGAPRQRERLRDVARHPKLWSLLGYASRGLIWAPYMAELLAARIEGEPLPLEAKLRDAIDPGRFRLARQRGRQ